MDHSCGSVVQLAPHWLRHDNNRCCTGLDRCYTELQELSAELIVGFCFLLSSRLCYFVCLHQHEVDFLNMMMVTSDCHPTIRAEIELKGTSDGN